MKPPVKVAFASGLDELNRQLSERMEALYPELPLYVVSEFPSERGRWIPYHVNRGFGENFARCRAAFRGKRIRLAGVLLVPGVPYRRMRLIALLLSPIAFLAFNENLHSFMLRPRCFGTICRHLLWRSKNFLRWQLRPGGHVYTFFWRLARPREWRIPLLYLAARLAPRWGRAPEPPPLAGAAIADGISVVIPSRNGRELLETQLPGLLGELAGFAAEVIVVDNGSDDGTAALLRSRFPGVLVDEESQPLSFARAVNRGIRRARFSHVCLLNNDMLLEPGFFAPLRRAFETVPGLFCATAQILFPAGIRREETGKAVMAQPAPTDFPVRCEEPLAGEDSSYVLYGSGGCSLYAADKLRALGGAGEVYDPAYVEDLDLGYRAWQRGWPSVFVAGARAEHRHRATTSRYYSPAQLEAMLELNYLRFLARAVAAPAVFRKLWRQAIDRLRRLAVKGSRPALEALEHAPRLIRKPPPAACSEELFLALGSGDVAVFPGRRRQSKPLILIASPYLPFPLSHGGAVRIYNLMLRAAADYDQVLVAFCDRLETPPGELRDLTAEIVLVRRHGSHSLPSTERPEVVEEFHSLAFRAALRETVHKWQPAIVQLEFTQMAQYAPDCAAARTILVEHDITFDLYQQLLDVDPDWDLGRQLSRWRRFEAQAWREVSCVVTMSEQDRRLVAGARAVALPNGVDLERFRPSEIQPEPRRLLFIGSFAHLPNLLALAAFLAEVWPRLAGVALHVIAGARPDYFRNFYRDKVTVHLEQPGIELDAFVADVRPAYQRATLVIAPLVASAGTNVKILEALSMGKAVVSTPAGIHGLDLISGQDLVVTSLAEMAGAITRLLENPAERRRLELQARARAERDYGWDMIAARQKALYTSLTDSAA